MCMDLHKTLGFLKFLLQSLQNLIWIMRFLKSNLKRSLDPWAAALLFVLSVGRALALPEVLKQIKGWVEKELLAGTRLSPLPCLPQPRFRSWGLPTRHLAGSHSRVLNASVSQRFRPADVQRRLKFDLLARIVILE